MTREELIEARQALGMTQAQLAFALECGNDTVRNWESVPPRRAIPGPAAVAIRFLVKYPKEAKAAKRAAAAA